VSFEFATTGRIIFGAGMTKMLSAEAKTMGSRVLLVTGRSAPIPSVDLPTFRYSVTGEPTVQTAREGVDAFHCAGCDMVIGIGGGSVIDAAKAIAALATNSGEPLDYLEVVGEGRRLENAPAPFIALPTTAGTGSEVTRNAVLGAPEHGVKASLRSPLMLPRLAIVDPDLTTGLPASVTASTGLDALTQLIEPYVSARANDMTDLYCLDGIRRVVRSLHAAYRHGTDIGARADMSFASLLGGLSLANAGLGVVHGFAAPVGGMFDAPHGAVCAALLPHGIATNVRALRQRAPQHRALERYRTIAIALTGNPAAKAEDSVEWVQELCAGMEIPGLGHYGVRWEHARELSGKASRASSMKANPIPLTESELEATLMAAL
jgi:alcohol dehydrogenase class IV